MARVKIEQELALKQIIRDSSLIPRDSFSYPFTRLLINRLKTMVAEGKVHPKHKEDALLQDASLIIRHLCEQLRTPFEPPNWRSTHVDELVARGEKFLSIFERA